MSGIRNGVQALFKQGVHCLAHNLKLYLQDASRKCKTLRNTMDFIRELVQLIKFLPKMLTVFERFKKETTK